MFVLSLALRSLLNRWTTAILAVAAIAIGVSLLLGVQMLREAAKQGFANTLSQTDLIVGARGGAVNLLLYSVFGIGEATANVSWESYRRIASHPDVEWTIPISLGDSHRGFRVLGTTGDYFQYYRFAERQRLRLGHGAPFAGAFEAVLGADVAARLGYDLRDRFEIEHGVGKVSFAPHSERPFEVVGILARTGTPADRAILVGLGSLSALHTPQRDQHGDLAELGSVTAFLVGLRARGKVFTMQRAINTDSREAMLAIMPGVAIGELWELAAAADKALMTVASIVVLTSILGMLSAILTSLNERRREMAILRSLGAHPQHIFGLMVAEAGLLGALGVLVGIVVTYGGLLAAQPLLQSYLGIVIAISPPSPDNLTVLGGIVLAALLTGLLPGFHAYRNALSDALQMRV